MSIPLESPNGSVRRDQPDKGAPLERTSAEAIAALRLELRWQSAQACHCDGRAGANVGLWRDLFPPALGQALIDKPVAETLTHRLTAGELAPELRDDLLLDLRPTQFNRHFLPRDLVQPRNGRFYPKGILRDVPGIPEADRSPFRVATASRELVQADLNHPLAGHELELVVTIEGIWLGGDRRGGHCNEIADLVTTDGPGMQARWRGQPTDFWSDLPFTRADPRPDDRFYARPRFVDHLDRAAIAEISSLHGRLIPTGARILDLMSSWHSHLPESLQPRAVTGLGMSQAELGANAQLTEHVVHDLNRDPRLPFSDAAFDAAVCTVSVEYLIEPFAVFRELARVLRPDGLLVVTFSNRWFPPKAIRIWQGVHEFERLGLVLEYFLESGRFTDLNTWSLRGLARPADDKYADRLPLSDPVYAVWGRRSSTGGA
ncbi:MAG: class I SAM-dependent methyltransferase [Chromatiales bacterium]|jgi:SAM-dependent methyltransferase